MFGVLPRDNFIFLRGTGMLATAAKCFKQQQNGWAVRYASDEMKGDRDLCTAAVAQNYGAYDYVSDEMKNDLGTALLATKGHLEMHPGDKGNQGELEQGAWEYMPERMKRNARVREIACLPN